MIQIRQLKIPATEEPATLDSYVASYLHISEAEIQSIHILKRSIDARKKPQIYYSYSVAVALADRAKSKVHKRFRNNDNVADYHEVFFSLPEHGTETLSEPPVIIGMGPAGLFCGLLLAQAGYRPRIIERGSAVEQRQKDVDVFWSSGHLTPDSNVQFGEGGAGTFSDGKLNTLVRDKSGRNRFVLETFVAFGAPEQILWDAKPHIGTDILTYVIRNIRNEIIRLGGTVQFDTKVNDLVIRDDSLIGLQTVPTAASAAKGQDMIGTQIAVLAIGHSARDTFHMLHQRGISMSAKEFAVGLRIEHPQQMIQESQYGVCAPAGLPVAPYKVATKLPNGRGVYSFCMCPGGYVVNASSVPGQLAVNGMSYARRDSANANSAIVISVGKTEYDQADPMGAIAYQCELEKKAYALAQGAIPQQLFSDFQQNTVSSSYGDFASVTKGTTAFTNLRQIFSEEMNQSFLQGMELFGRRIQGFDRGDAILSGVESRTSSPVRIHRDEHFLSNMEGLYPCGEGAGYAGGIMSAAMDGIRIAEEIIRKYQVNYES